MQISVHEVMKSTKRGIIRQKLQEESSRGQINFGIQFQTFLSKCNTRNVQSDIWTTADKNFIPKTEATITLNTTSWKRSCNQFPSLMSEPYLRTWSKTFMHLKMFKFVSSLRRSETHIRNAQANQRASASTGSINIIWNTIFAVYEVDSQKTVNTGLGKRNIWFSEVIKEFYHYFQENPEKERHKKIEKRIAFLCEGLLIDITKTCD